jgi:hypothetical protein
MVTDPVDVPDIIVVTQNGEISVTREADTLGEVVGDPCRDVPGRGGRSVDIESVISQMRINIPGCCVTNGDPDVRSP